MAQLTKKQIRRQDFVDNEIFELIQKITPHSKIKWDIEIIGDVRDSIQRGLVDRHNLISGAGFYPYLKI